MAEIIVRNIVGFIVQIAPAAILCLLPFDGRFRVSTKRAWLAAGAIVVAGLAPLLLIAACAYFAPQSAVAGARSLLQNLVFLVTVAALFTLYVRVVRAEASHVRSASAAEITLDNGSTLPVSRRRLADLREALGRAPHDAAGEVRA